MIVIPMCGNSQRFFDAGYELPKYQLPIKDKTLFYKVLDGFKDFFHNEIFLFIIKEDYYNTLSFIQIEIIKLGIQKYKIVSLDYDTNGQAETVYKGLQPFSGYNEQLIIYNIDTINKKISIPKHCYNSDGYLETFVNTNKSDNKWSFIFPGKKYKVLSTTEKERISDFCCTGLYGFKSIDLYNHYYKYLEKVNNELYIAPMYNLLIKDGLDIKYSVIDKKNFIPCGTPQDYKCLINL